MPAPTSIYQIKVTLKDSKPPIWRRVLVEDKTTLLKLHDVLQTVMGWTDSHLHHYIINGEFYGAPEDDEFGDLHIKDESRYKLNQIVNRAGFKLRYEYDFGDSWEHDLVVEKILPAEGGVRYPVCVAGKRACPPEDVGGVWGYEDFLNIIANPKHDEHEDTMMWVGGSFDPEKFSMDEVNKALRHPHSREAEVYEPPQLSNLTLERIVNWSQGLDKDGLAIAESVEARRDMATFLKYIKEKHPTGTQSTGNLPLKAVREICAQFVHPPELDHKVGDQIFKLRSEDDIWYLFFLHTLAHVGGLVTGGQARAWKLTDNGEAFLNFRPPVQIGMMLDTWWKRINWAIAFPVSGLNKGLPYNFEKISLSLLLELPIGKPVAFKSFADRLIQETRMTWDSVDQTFAHRIMQTVVERTVIDVLRIFEMIKTDYEMEKTGDSEFSNLSRITLTPFGKGLLDIL